MLADGGGSGHVSTGRLRETIHHPSEWISTLVVFIGEALQAWRNDPDRSKESGETLLTNSLCSTLNTEARRINGWDHIQFKQEVPDDVKKARKLDLGVSPCNSVIVINERRYSHFDSLLPIECKRLPTPNEFERDNREYLYSHFSTTGGVQRFKAGLHGVSHSRALMIAYIQEQTILDWIKQINDWVIELQSSSIDGWTFADQCQLVVHDTTNRIAQLSSTHARPLKSEPIDLDHLWIEM